MPSPPIEGIGFGYRTRYAAASVKLGGGSLAAGVVAAPVNGC